jgi:glycosyltransferase involved in cell wall biosynthesis
MGSRPAALRREEASTGRRGAGPPLCAAFGFLDLADGGAQRLTLAACRHFSPRWRPVVACARGAGRLVQAARASGIEVQTLGRLERPWDLTAVLPLARCLGELAAEVLHVPLYSRAAPYWRLAARLARVPLVVAHEWGRAEAPRAPRALADRLLAPDTRFVATSEAHRRELEACGTPADAIRVVRSGIEIARFEVADPERSRAQVRQRLALTERAPVLLVPARLHPMKGHADLLAALPHLLRRFPALAVLCAGAGPLAAELASSASAAGLGEAVRLLGHREDVPALLSAADLVVLPSRSEGLPAALLEAYAARRAVVATAVGGVPEALHDGCEGRLVPAAEPAALAAAVEQLVAAPALCARMGERGRARVEAEYRVEDSTRQLEATYVDWLAGRGRRAA